MNKSKHINFLGVFLIICFASVWSGNALAQIVTATTRNVPVIPSQYVSPSQYHATYGTAGFIDNGTHGDFLTNSTPPTVIGQPASHSFGSFISAVWHPQGLSPITITAPAQCNVSMTKTAQVGGLETFQTEMLQLDIQGGNLPAGVRIRESPTLQSTGQTHINSIGGGQYQIDSFFDVFTELSTDNGATWQPSTTGATHMQLLGTSPIPTLSQWGMILCGLMLLIAGSVFIMKRQIV